MMIAAHSKSYVIHNYFFLQFTLPGATFSMLLMIFIIWLLGTENFSTIDADQTGINDRGPSSNKGTFSTFF